MKTAFITGGTRGIGLGIAQALLADGWNVAVTGRSEASVHAALEQLGAADHSRVAGFVCDVRQYSGQVKAVEATIARFGGIDLLVANAGIGHFAPIGELDIEQWQETIDTNLTGAFFSVKACLHALINSKGYIITLSLIHI